jgi:uncharacterized protein YheU (UPF0270 family)
MAGATEEAGEAGEAGEPVVVPHTELAPDVLRAVVESYVLREGTDYGEREVSLVDKVARVITQLQRGDAQIVFDPDTDTVSIVQSTARSGSAARSGRDV